MTPVNIEMALRIK